LGKPGAFAEMGGFGVGARERRAGFAGGNGLGFALVALRGLEHGADGRIVE
jgi:hypothetical protein